MISSLFSCNSAGAWHLRIGTRARALIKAIEFVNKKKTEKGICELLTIHLINYKVAVVRAEHFYFFFISGLRRLSNEMYKQPCGLL